MTTYRAWFIAAALACPLVALSIPASAQLGTVNNPPPQNLFGNKGITPRDNGLGTMAERRRQLDQVHRTRRVPVKRR